MLWYAVAFIGGMVVMLGFVIIYNKVVEIWKWFNYRSYPGGR